MLNNVMPAILIVEKNGNIKELSIKTWNEEDLYKKAGFKSKDGFKCYTIWSTKLDDIKYDIFLYGKTAGKANQENKYEFPPPVDNTLFFGNCVLVNKTEDNVKNLTSKEWNAIYEILYGGFEDIGDSDNDIEEEDDLDGLKLTKDGYVKDDFIVDSSDDDYDEDEDNYEQSDEDEVIVKKIKKAKKVEQKKNTKKVSSNKVVPIEETVDNYLDCTDELQEEEFV